MGKNKLTSKNPGSSKNPIYKKVGAGAPLKTKNKTKQVKTNLKKLKITNKEAVTSLDKQLGAFREAIQHKSKKTTGKQSVTTTTGNENTHVNVEEATDGLSKL